VYGPDEESKLIRELLPLRDDPIDKTFDLLHRRSGIGLLLPTEQEVYTYGNIRTEELAFGALAT
jgi:hypothetical protein